jgi:hypothetical protein
MDQGLLLDVPAYEGNTDDNQRYTIRRARDWCKRTAGVTEWDLDAAACQVSHHAPVWYDGKNRGSGLALPWWGDTFVNPPWDNIEPWVMKAWRAWSRAADLEREAEQLPTLISISMLLPGGRTHRPWWRELVEPFRDGGWFLDIGEQHPTAYLRTHNPPERFPYGGPGNVEGVGVGEPNFTSVLLVWRSKRLDNATPKLLSADSLPAAPGAPT